MFVSKLRNNAGVRKVAKPSAFQETLRASEFPFTDEE
jgi:hypothetical protein